VPESDAGVPDGEEPAHTLTGSCSASPGSSEGAAWLIVALVGVGLVFRRRR